MDGGAPGGKAWAVIRRADGTEETVPSKIVTRLFAGDRFVLATAGGGGRGDPRARPALLVADDVANGKVTSTEACEAYGQNIS